MGPLKWFDWLTMSGPDGRPLILSVSKDMSGRSGVEESRTLAIKSPLSPGNARRFN